jgi:transcriptional regulator with XRE-family HTH domain
VPRSFEDLYREAERREEYWVAGAILEFTESLTAAMEAQGVSRAELARRLGVSAAYVTKMLRGNANFTLRSMVRVARALQATFRPRLERPVGEGIDRGEWRIARGPSRVVFAASPRRQFEAEAAPIQTVVRSIGDAPTGAATDRPEAA